MKKKKFHETRASSRDFNGETVRRSVIATLSNHTAERADSNSCERKIRFRSSRSESAAGLIFKRELHVESN